MSIDTFTNQITSAVQSAVLRFLSSDNWLLPDYNSRVKVPPELIAQAWALVDVSKIKALLAKRIEQELADRIMNHLATEMATDIKQILGVQERREKLRSIAREHIETIMRARVAE